MVQEILELMKPDITEIIKHILIYTAVSWPIFHAVSGYNLKGTLKKEDGTTKGYLETLLDKKTIALSAGLSVLVCTAASVLYSGTYLKF